MFCHYIFSRVQHFLSRLNHSAVLLSILFSYGAAAAGFQLTRLASEHSCHELTTFLLSNRVKKPIIRTNAPLIGCLRCEKRSISPSCAAEMMVNSTRLPRSRIGGFRTSYTQKDQTSLGLLDFVQVTILLLIL